MSGDSLKSKVDVIRRLAESKGYRRYLEIATSTTGWRYGQAREIGFDVCARLVYNCPETFSDNEPMDYVSKNLDIAECLAAIDAERFRPDIVFVDPHHTYECSKRDIEVAFGLIREGGAVVVHDCAPWSRDLAAPDFQPGMWMGLTYKAYLDFVLGKSELEYHTVMIDYGCGVIIKERNWPVGNKIKEIVRLAIKKKRQAQIAREFLACGNNYDAAFELFMKERNLLLHSVSFDMFCSKHCQKTARTDT